MCEQQVLKMSGGTGWGEGGTGRLLCYPKLDFDVIANFWHYVSINNRFTAAPRKALTIPSADR